MNHARIRPDDRPESAPGVAGSALADMEAVRRKRLAQIPARQRPIFLRAWTGKSRKAPACALYPYREGRL
jgi:hypothetical protein